MKEKPRDKTISAKRPIFILVTLLLLFGITVLVDIILGVSGFPSEFIPQYVNPANYTEIRRSLYEFEIEFSTNSKGIRYREIPTSKSKPNERRIFAVGDSYTEGQGVELKDTFLLQLESHYNSNNTPVHFINGGFAGAGPMRYKDVLLRVGSEYDIDAAVICLFANDIVNCTNPVNSESGIQTRTRPDGLARIVSAVYPRMYTLALKSKGALKNIEYYRKKRDIVSKAISEARRRGISEEDIQAWHDRIPTDLVEAANRFEFNGSILTSGLLSPSYWTDSIDVDREKAVKNWNNMKTILYLMVNWCRQKNIEVAIVFIPAPAMYDEQYHRPDDLRIVAGMVVRKQWLTETTKVQQLLSEWSSLNDVPYLDLTDVFRKAKGKYSEPINYPLNSHWTPLGHKIAAEAISQWIDEKKLFGLSHDK